MDIVVVADTHLHDDIRLRMPAALLGAMASADVVLHAGDVVSQQALADLRAIAHLRAVLGNNDHELVGVLPETMVLDLDGVTVAMIHDSGPTRGRPARLHRRFPQADVVIFGHSHAPCNDHGIGEQVLFNPGSPTQRRMQPRCSYGHLLVERGKVVERQICWL